MFSIIIQTGNDAFAEDPISEITRLLRVLADRLDHETTAGPHLTGQIADQNGNPCGTWSLDGDNPAPIGRTVRRQ